MKLAPAATESAVRNLPKNIKAVLIYGPEQGLADERAALIVPQILGANADPFSLVEIAPEKLKDDPALLLDEINAISFFGGRKLIKIRQAPDSAAKSIARAIELMPEGDASPFLLVTAGELTPRSPLRAFFEKAKAAYSIACYVDDFNGIANVLRVKLREGGYQYENGVIDLLASCLTGNRMVLMQELEKLFLYKGEDKKISIEDVKNILIDASESTLDELCLAVADRDIAKVYRHYGKSLAQGAEPVRIIRYLSNYFGRMFYVYGKIKDRVPEQEAISSIRPPIFFKNLPYFKRHIGFWAKSSSAENNKIDRAFKLLLEAEAGIKSSTDPELICSDYLLQLCKIG